MIFLTNCFSHHILGHIILLSSTASHHDMWCLWCDCTSGRCFFVFDGNLLLSVLLCFDGETFDVRLCLTPSEVKLRFAPSEVHYCLLFRWGEPQLSFFVVWRLRKYRPRVSKLLSARHRPYKMGLPVADIRERE
jgi:hypothetical protein